jgi:hypothetical protein
MYAINPDIAQEYDIIAQSYTKGGDFPVDPCCNSWTAINAGDTRAVVNGIPLLPFPPGHPELTGAAIAIPGNRDEFYRGRIFIVFDALPGVTPLIVIVQKFYK